MPVPWQSVKGIVKAGVEFESEADEKTDAKTIMPASFEVNEESKTMQADSEDTAQTDQGKKTIVQCNKWLAPVSKRPTVIAVLSMVIFFVVLVATGVMRAEHADGGAQVCLAV